MLSLRSAFMLYSNAPSVIEKHDTTSGLNIYRKSMFSLQFAPVNTVLNQCCNPAFYVLSTTVINQKYISGRKIYSIRTLPDANL